MQRLQPQLLIGAIALALIAPGGASAGFFGGDTVDGPSADIVRVGGVDAARDGGGVVVYVKKVTGIDHVFAARLVDGTWQRPERLDPALPLPSGEPVVGVADRGAAVVAFTNNGQLYTIVRRPSATTWPAPVATAAPAATPSIDLSVNGVGYVAWASSGDVKAATLDRTGTAFKPVEGVLDITPDSDAGSGLGRPEIAASADGTALAAWGENGHVYARRVFHTQKSTIPQDLTVTDFNSHVGGVADSPVVDIADDSSFAWVSFRQAFDANATTRVLARRLVGSAFDPPADVGAGSFGGEGAGAPALDVTGIGDGIFASESTSSHTPFAALLYLDVLRAPFGLSAANSVVSAPAVASGETSQAAAAWFDASGAPATVHARSFKFAKPADTEVSLSDPALGAVDPAAGLAAASDKYGDTVIPYVQGLGPTRRLMAGRWDRPPVNLIATTTSRWRTPKPLGWELVSEPWGAITYSVVIDGNVLGTTIDKASFPIAGRVSDGVHRWRLVATDARGQHNSTTTRTLRIDTTGPRLAVSIKGKHKAGNALRLVAHASDPYSGLASVKFDFGDGSGPVFATTVRRAFAKGSHVVTVRAVDRLGNASTVTRRVTVR